MDVDWVRKFCLTLPHTTQVIQWGNHLVFKVGGKMYAVVALEPGGIWMSLKSSPEKFAELTERPGIIPAPYLARAQWIALEEDTDLIRQEIRILLRSAYNLVFAKLPRKTRVSLSPGNTVA